MEVIIIIGVVVVFTVLGVRQYDYCKEQKRRRDIEHREADRRYVDEYNRTHETKISLPKEPGGYFTNEVK